MKKIVTAVISIAAFLLVSCSSTPVQMADESTPNGSSGGVLRLALSSGNDTDVLAKRIREGISGDTIDVEHIWVTIKEVQIHTSGSSEEKGWKTVATPGARFDFLELVNGLTAPLDLYALPAGHYTQIRLFLESEAEEGEELPNCIVIDGETYPLTIPSVFKSGIKCVRAFTIKENEMTEICLRFDVFKAIHYAPGNGYMMRPAYQTYKCDSSEDDESEDDEDIDDSDDNNYIYDNTD
jgi:hypothetical protein